LSFEFYGQVWLRFVGKTFEEPAEAFDFQAEYEGSIPFTRSNIFNCLDEMGILIPTKRAE